MDGKGRWLDNVYVKRFWRSLKVEEINLHAYTTPAEARERISDYIRYVNEERPHQGLDNLTPDNVYYRRRLLPEAVWPGMIQQNPTDKRPVRVYRAISLYLLKRTEVIR